MREQIDVETRLVDPVFILRQQVKQECRQPACAQGLGDERISRAQPAAAAAMGEQHDRLSTSGYAKRSTMSHRFQDYLDGLFVIVVSHVQAIRSIFGGAQSGSMLFLAEFAFGKL